MQLIGARLRDHVDLPAHALAVFRAIGVAHHVEFAYSVDAQQLPADASGRDPDIAAAGVFNPIQQEEVLFRAPPGHGEIACLARASLASGLF